eukprot:CAMPEP_0184681720 /NCGR_PEP_ID=MMETSP0312-20130426/4693_1 /TAXON_ID=31354 /ORGANISM="Compsopogon coeruleus, Strain SAG 36.94" /LENGTH=169 /DNA_ID=CAMNT_0027132725 /DNA_START=166 /DNA_END=675 /DNA_ORIENTATION=+
MTKAISAGLLSIVSDLVAKRLTKEPVKSSSLINELSMGLVIRGPVQHYFQQFLDKVVFAGKKQSSPAVVLGKMVIDCFIFSPLYNALYFIIVGLMADQPTAESLQKIQKLLFSVMKSNWTVWVPVNIISYAVVPLELRVLFGNVISIFWTAFLIKKVKGDSQRTTHTEE